MKKRCFSVGRITAVPQQATWGVPVGLSRVPHTNGLFGTYCPVPRWCA